MARQKTRRLSFSQRVALIEQFNRTCHYCGESSGTMTAGPDGMPWVIDHFTPLSRGGSDTWDNLVLSCRTCNQFKGSILPEEFGLLGLEVPELPEAGDKPRTHIKYRHNRRPNKPMTMEEGRFMAATMQHLFYDPPGTPKPVPPASCIPYMDMDAYLAD